MDNTQHHMKPPHIPFQQQLIMTQQLIQLQLIMIIQVQPQRIMITQVQPQLRIIHHTHLQLQPMMSHTPAHRLKQNKLTFLHCQHHTLPLMNTSQLRLLLIQQQQTMEQVMISTIW